jgi:phospho-2-dehydro-3-deoxyheptonate aldolase
MPGGAVYGQSITDARMSLEQTEAVLKELANAHDKRGMKSALRYATV